MERATLVRPGAIFVWIECEDDAGLKRWTGTFLLPLSSNLTYLFSLDGRVWGQSRMREVSIYFWLRYEWGANIVIIALPLLWRKTAFRFSSKLVWCKSVCLIKALLISVILTLSTSSHTYRFVDSAPRMGPSSSALSHQDRTTVQHPGLVKQAYSAWVSPDPRSKPQKWHLTAYFTYSELSTLPTIDREPLLQRIIVPSGIYRSGNARSRSDEEIPTVRRPNPSSGRSENRTPQLPSLQLTVPESHSGIRIQHRPIGTRLPEDHRVIQMLNSRHIL